MIVNKNLHIGCTVHEECDCDPGVDDDDQMFEK